MNIIAETNKEIKELENKLKELREKITTCNFCGSERKPTNYDYYNDSLNHLRGKLEGLAFGLSSKQKTTPTGEQNG